LTWPATAARPAPFGKQPQCFVRQDTARDRDRDEPGLRGDIGTRNHDLIHLGGDLLHGRGKNQPTDTAPQDRAHAHHARLAGSVERAALERGCSMIGEAAANRDHLPMRGRIAVGSSEIATACKNLAVPHDHCAERKITLASFVQGPSA